MPSTEESPLEFLKARGKAPKRSRPTTKKAAAEAEAPAETCTDCGG
jgi:hypothetical protein